MLQALTFVWKYEHLLQCRHRILIRSTRKELNMNMLSVLVGTALLVGFSYANAQSHADAHAGQGRGRGIPPHAAHSEGHGVPAVAPVRGSHSPYRHGAAAREPHRESRHGMDHGRREHQRRSHDSYVHRPRGH